MSNPRLIPFPGADSEPHDSDVVFVHGLDGDGVSTWHPPNQPSLSFPAWLATDLPRSRLWSLEYDAFSLAWKGGGMPLSDRAASILALFDAHGLGDRPLAFVTHSLGGLVVKQLLRHATDFDDEWLRVSHNTKAIVFIATPHSGSKIADWVDHVRRVLRKNEIVDDLADNDHRLRELNTWFRRFVQKSGLPTQIYCEKLKTNGVLVVDEASADAGIAGVTAIILDHDHISICKPESRDDLLYRRVVRFLSRHLIVQPDARATPSATGDCTSPGDDQHAVSVIVGQHAVQLTIEGNLKDFTLEKRQQLLRTVQTILELSSLPKADVRSGSVLVTFRELSYQQAEQLFWAVERGEFDAFGVTKARIIDKPLQSTVAVNAAFLHEIKEVNQELWQMLRDLRHRSQRPIAPGHCRVLIDLMCQFRDQLALHFALEEAYGYFDDPVEVDPQLARRAEQMRGEHKGLYFDLCGLVDRAERMFYDEQHSALALWIGPEFLAFEEQFRRHEEREKDIIFEAYDRELGLDD